MNFQIFGFSIFFSSHSYIQIKKCVWREYLVFFFFLDHQTKKLIKNIFVNSGYFKSKQEFSIFPLLLFKNLRSKGREYLTAFALISYWF